MSKRLQLAIFAVITFVTLIMVAVQTPDRFAVCQSPDWPEPTCTAQDLSDYGF